MQGDYVNVRRAQLSMPNVLAAPKEEIGSYLDW
jgi:hypothetical protein